MKKWILIGLVLISGTSCNGNLNAPSNHETTTPELSKVIEREIEIQLPSGIKFIPEAQIQNEIKVSLDKGLGGYYLVQFNHSLDQATRDTLENIGVIFFDYVPNYAYFVYLPPDSLPTLDILFAKGNLRYLGSIPVEAKLEIALRHKIQEGTETAYNVTIQFFEELKADEQIALKALMDITATSFGPVNFAEGVVEASKVDAVLALPFVKWMEEQVLYKPDD